MFGFSFGASRRLSRTIRSNERMTHRHTSTYLSARLFFPNLWPIRFFCLFRNSTQFIDRKLVAIRKFTWKMYTNCAGKHASALEKCGDIFLLLFVIGRCQWDGSATNDMLNYYNCNYFDFLFFEMSSHFSFEMVSIRREQRRLFSFIIGRPFTVTERKKKKLYFHRTITERHTLRTISVRCKKNKNKIMILIN